LIRGGLIESGGKATEEQIEAENEEEIILSIIFTLYNSCFYRIRTLVETIVGGSNPMYQKFLASFRNGFLTYFPGYDPAADTQKAFDKFYAEIIQIPASVRMHKLMNALENMLSNQLEYVFYFLGQGVYRQAAGRVKKEITGPLALKRELVKRFQIDENLMNSVKKADRVVRLVKGAS